MKTRSTTFVMGASFIAVIMLISAGSIHLENNSVTAQEALPPITNTDERLISTTGTATTSVEPDLLVVTFGVETQEITAKESFDANTQFMNSTITAIQSVGITSDEISTSRFNIYPVYDGYEDPITKRWKQELTGYQVTNTITVETSKLDLAADIIDGAVTAGVNRVDDVSFTLSPEKHMHLKDDLIEKAILNAKAKAENALSPLDYSITGVKAGHYLNLECIHQYQYQCLTWHLMKTCQEVLVCQHQYSHLIKMSVQQQTWYLQSEVTR